jgi:hypothetical protein
VSGHVFVSTFYWSTCTKPWKWVVMYLCQLFIEAPVPSQESEWSCIYVNLLLKHLYQARKVSSHVFMSTFYWSTCTKSGKWVVMYLCQLFIEAPVPSQESEWSCICVNFWLFLQFLYWILDLFFDSVVFLVFHLISHPFFIIIKYIAIPIRT